MSRLKRGALLFFLVFLTAPALCFPGKTTYKVPMRDGVRLTTDVYLPRGEGPFPTLLMRTPYTRKVDGPGPARTLTPQGYAVVIQDLRGHYQSEGEATFLLDMQEAWDGQDTIRWIVQQPWSNGAVGTFGPSAKGAVQYALAPFAPPELKCMYVQIAPARAYDGVFQGDVYHLGWGLSTSLVQKLIRGAKLERRERSGTALVPELVYRQKMKKFLDPDFLKFSSSVHIPIAHVSGWFDMFTEGTLAAFQAFQQHGGQGARGRQKLVIGPWTHVGSGGRRAGALYFPPNAQLPLKVSDWFDRCLKHRGSLKEIPTVQYYVMGSPAEKNSSGNRWRQADRFPPAAKKVPLYLQADASLSRRKPTQKKRFMSYLSDPLHPVPYLCGAELFLRAGPCDLASLDQRADVLTFTTTAMKQPLEVTGSLDALVYLSSSAADTDLVVKVADLYPSGRALWIVTGIQRARFREGLFHPHFLEPDRVYPLKVHLGTTSFVLNRGHRLRIYIMSSSFPSFIVNPQTIGELGLSLKAVQAMREKGGNISSTELYGQIVTTKNKIYLSAYYPSQIHLPLP